MWEWSCEGAYRMSRVWVPGFKSCWASDSSCLQSQGFSSTCLSRTACSIWFLPLIPFTDISHISPQCCRQNKPSFFSFFSSTTFFFFLHTLTAVLFTHLCLDIFSLNTNDRILQRTTRRSHCCSIQWLFISAVFSCVCLLHGCSIPAACSHPGTTCCTMPSSATGTSIWWTSHLSGGLSGSIFPNKNKAEICASQTVLWDMNLQ